MQEQELRVGELARRTGLTVRTLHHYDQIGLFSPSSQSAAGHRLYGTSDLRRLLKICALRKLGLPLHVIKKLQQGESSSLLEVLNCHIAELKKMINRQQDLHAKLEAIVARLPRESAADMDSLFQIIKEIEMSKAFEKYYTQEQLAWLKERAETVGQERIREVEAEWPRLIAEVRAEMAAGTDPKSDRMQELSARWDALVKEFTGGNPEIEQALSNMYRNEPAIANQPKGVDLDSDVFSYVDNASSSSKKNER